MSIFQEFLDEAKHLLKQATIEANTNDSAPDSQTDTLPESPNAVTPVKEPETKTKKSKKNKVKIVPKVVEETKIDVENGDNDRNDEDMILTADDVATGSPDIKNASNLKDAYVINPPAAAAPQPFGNIPKHLRLAIVAGYAKRKKEEEEERENTVSNVESTKEAKILDSVVKTVDHLMLDSVSDRAKRKAEKKVKANVSPQPTPNAPQPTPNVPPVKNANKILKSKSFMGLKEAGILDSIGKSLGKGIIGKALKWTGEHPIKTFLGGAALSTVATAGVHALSGQRRVPYIDPNTQYYASLGWANNPGLSRPFGGNKLASELLNNEYFLAGLLDALNK